MAFVKTRIFLDQKSNGEIVDILYEDTAANEPLVRSIESLGHIILSNSKDKKTTIDMTPPNIANNTTTDKLQLIRTRIQVKK